MAQTHQKMTRDAFMTLARYQGDINDVMTGQLKAAVLKARVKGLAEVVQKQVSQDGEKDTRRVRRKRV